jgi:tRNA(His) 5'-end guanylyltransferase
MPSPFTNFVEMNTISNYINIFFKRWVPMIWDLLCAQPHIEEAPNEEANEDMASSELLNKTQHVLELMKKYQPVEIPGMDMSLHYVPPHIPKKIWTDLGDKVVVKERQLNSSNIEGSKWISLRLDGQGFSKTVKKLRHLGILEEGFSPVFADAMIASLLCLMETMNGAVGYTQSDEMIVFIPPTSVIKGVRQPHQRNGRVSKVTTLAAGLVSSVFTAKLAELCSAKNIPISELTSAAPHFDCRIGQYNSWEEAQGLLLWRTYDCSVNGISDAVYQTKKCPKLIREAGKIEKLTWLHEQGYLPLHRHQAYGSCFVRVKRLRDGFNPQHNKAVRVLRSVIEACEGPVQELFRTDSLRRRDDEPEQEDR